MSEAFKIEACASAAHMTMRAIHDPTGAAIRPWSTLREDEREDIRDAVRMVLAKDERAFISQRARWTIEEVAAAVAPLAEHGADVERRYREHLALSHQHASALYGDDGELQCNVGGCNIDFRRDPLEKIEAKLMQQKLAALAAATANMDVKAV